MRWSPDGRYVYFNFGFQSLNAEPTEIFRVPASGGPIEPVVRTARRAVNPFPSADGHGLFYAANPDGVDLNLFWRDLRTGRDVRLTTGVGEYRRTVGLRGTAGAWSRRSSTSSRRWTVSRSPLTIRRRWSR